MQSIIIDEQSTVTLTAGEILPLAIEMIRLHDQKRERLIRSALEDVKHQRCSHFFGLWTHQKYPDEETARRFAPEILHIKQLGASDYRVCRILKELCSRVPADKPITLTLSDYAALVDF